MRSDRQSGQQIRGKEATSAYSESIGRTGRRGSRQLVFHDPDIGFREEAASKHEIDPLFRTSLTYDEIHESCHLIACEFEDILTDKVIGFLEIASLPQTWTFECRCQEVQYRRRVVVLVLVSGVDGHAVISRSDGQQAPRPRIRVIVGQNG